MVTPALPCPLCYSPGDRVVDAAFPVASAPGVAVSCPRCVGLVQPEPGGRPQPRARLWQPAGTSVCVGKGNLPEPPLAAPTLLQWKLGGHINELQNEKDPVLLSMSGAG